MEKRKFIKKKRNQLSLLFAFVFIIWLLAHLFYDVDKSKEIKTGAYWTAPVMDEGQVEMLAKHDLLIIDIENMTNNRRSFKLLKEFNPDIKLICYSNPMEFWFPMVDSRPIQRRWLGEISNFPAWFLKAGDGSQGVFWDQMIMMNLSSTCPKYNGKTYTDWMAEKLLKEVLKDDDIWDGYFMDNGGGNISWVQDGKAFQFDIDGDGVSDDPAYIDRAWYEGVHGFLKKIRKAKGKDFIILANKGSVEMMDVLDGRMFENFPNDYLGSTENFGWNQSMANAKKMIKEGAKYTIFKVHSENEINLGLASANLLDDVYFMVGQDNPRYYPIFDSNLGEALTDLDTFENSLFYREFENARIVVNPAEKSGQISFKAKTLSQK